MGVDLLSASMSNYTNEQLTGTTGAVRNYMANASEKEKTEKKGQQQWGLFETNYQRNKGISTDQSLQEIDEFCSGGVRVNAGGEEWSIGGKAGSTSQCGSCGTVPDPNQKFCSNCGAQLRAVIQTHGTGGQGGFGGSGARGGGFGASGGAGGLGGPGTGNLNFAEGTNSGAAFFNQHMANEQKKYQPERKW